MRITLEITTGPCTGQKLWLRPQQSIVIGRTQLAEFSLPGDSHLSSVHFQVEWKNDGFCIRDLKSTNGTKLNGQPVRDATLQSGDVILAGTTSFAVLIEADVGTSTGQTTAVLPAAERTIQPSLKPEEKLAVPNSRKSTLVLPAESTSKTFVFETPVRDVAAAESETDDVDEPTALLAVDNHTPFSVAYLPWQNAEGLGRLTVIVKATFRFTESEIAVAEKQLPIWFADQHDEDDPLKPVRLEADTAPFKPRADVVLVGKAYSPNGRPRGSVDVRLRVGGLERRLRIFGDRKWLFPTRLAMIPQITDPVPFSQMPLTYARSFGGIDESAGRYCAENLSGIGFIGEPSPASIHNKPLPNIEDPDQLIGSWDARPKPVGFGFYGRGWQPRLSFAGTYDDDYRRKRAPRPPEDFSYDVHNGAHPNLQVAGYLDGDEFVELENLTPEGYATFTLPGIRPQITLTRNIVAAKGKADLAPVGNLKTRTERPVMPFLDSLVFVPDERLVYEVFRAVFAIPNFDDIDVAGIRID